MSKALTRLREGHKHGYFQSVRCLRMATLFQLSCLCTRSRWIAGSLSPFRISGFMAYASTAEQVSQDLGCYHLDGFVHNSTHALTAATSARPRHTSCRLGVAEPGEDIPEPADRSRDSDSPSGPSTTEGALSMSRAPCNTKMYPGLSGPPLDHKPQLTVKVRTSRSGVVFRRRYGGRR